jgi:hypothetical protein
LGEPSATAQTGAAGPQRAQVDLLQARIAFASRRGSDAPALLLNVARELEPLDVGLARATYMEALLRPIERRDRRASVHQPAHRRLPPAKGLQQAGHHLTQPALERAAARAERGAGLRANGSKAQTAVGDLGEKLT